MSHLATWTAETQADILDLDRLVEVITEIDDNLHDITNRLIALENAVLSLNAALDLIDQRVIALENR